MGAAAQSRTLSWRSSTYTTTTSHSSHLLIGLLLSIGIPVIGYFTLVRLELAECKGQPTSLSGSCTLLIHQLSSAITRQSKCSETLLPWISFAMSVIYPQTMLSSHLKNEEVAMKWVTCLLVGMCWGGRQRGSSVDYLEDCSFCWVLWPPAVLRPLPLLRNTQNQTNTVCLINDDYKGKKKVLPTAAQKGWAHC